MRADMQKYLPKSMRRGRNFLRYSPPIESGGALFIEKLSH